MSNEQILKASSSATEKSWSIDTNASLQEILDDPECPLLLRQTLVGTLSWQTRNETPIHRALSSPHIAPQWIAALLALGTTVTVKGDDGATEMPFETLAQRKEMKNVTSLHVQVQGIRWGEARVARTLADKPIVAAIAAVKMNKGVVQQARVALTGVWSKPVGLAEAAGQLVGNPLDTEYIQAVADAVEKEVTPKEDFLGSEEYRRSMAGVLTRRVLERCQRQETGDD